MLLRLRFLCCTCEADLWDWITCVLRAQVRPPAGSAHSALACLLRTLPFQNHDPAPPVLRRHSSSDISKQKFGTMPLVPIRGDESNSSMLSANQTLVSTPNPPASLDLLLYICLSPPEEAPRQEDPLHVLRKYLQVGHLCRTCGGGA